MAFNARYGNQQIAPGGLADMTMRQQRLLAMAISELVGAENGEKTTFSEQNSGGDVLVEL